LPHLAVWPGLKQFFPSFRYFFLFFPGPGCRGYFSLGVFIMDNTNQKRYYSPQFSGLAVVAVRRLAWAMHMNMGQAVDVMVSCLPGFIRTEKVCSACKDNSKCQECIFKIDAELPAQAAALLY
jgi:hypothetical protein